MQTEQKTVIINGVELQEHTRSGCTDCFFNWDGDCNLTEDNIHLIWTVFGAGCADRQVIYVRSE